jgi:PPM family protein phosphatase
MRFSIYQMSRLGGRDSNQDRMGYCYSREAALFVVADGMGGHPEGEVAAQITLQTMAARFQREMKPTVQNPQEFLRLSILMAHQQILRYAANKGMHDSPRTTIIMCLVQEGVGYWAHVGDSRLYLVRKGQLLARTRDHSHIEVARANNAPDAALNTINRNVLYSCLGSPSSPEIMFGGPTVLEQGDSVLLCSDGLWSPLEDSDILKSLAAKAVVDAVPELVELALKTAGERSDNVTGLAFEWEGVEEFVESESLSTMSLGEDMYASTISAMGSDELPDELDDDAIERSIAEIRRAIEKSAKRPKL